MVDGLMAISYWRATRTIVVRLPVIPSWRSAHMSVIRPGVPSVNARYALSSNSISSREGAIEGESSSSCRRN
jgi:hypothetical protein